MKLTKRHLGIFDIYEGKKEILENVGTLYEKELFQNGEFEIISELITTEFKIKSKQLSITEVEKYNAKVNVILDSRCNKKTLKYLSKKYCEPIQEQSTFKSIMDMLWAMFG